MQRLLTPLQARVLAVLVEKQATVPDSYPLSLNTLTLGCNQKTARDPVLNAAESEVLAAVEELRELSLVCEVSGARVLRFEHNMGRGLGVPGQAVALLALLILRGPQTAAELRLHTERLHRFTDVSSVEGFLEELAEKEPARVLKLARAPGAREARWAHLLCGPVLQAPPGVDLREPNAAADMPASDELAALRREQRRMAAELDELRALVQRIAGDLGIETKTD